MDMEKENLRLYRELAKRDKMLLEATEKLKKFAPIGEKPKAKQGFQISFTRSYWRRIPLPISSLPKYNDQLELL